MKLLNCRCLTEKSIDIRCNQCRQTIDIDFFETQDVFACLEHFVETRDIAAATFRLIAPGRSILIRREEARLKRVVAGHAGCRRAEKGQHGCPVTELMAPGAGISPRRSQMQGTGVAGDKYVGEINER